MTDCATGPAWPDRSSSLAEQLEASLLLVNGDMVGLAERGVLYVPSAYSEMLADWVHAELGGVRSIPVQFVPMECDNVIR